MRTTSIDPASTTVEVANRTVNRWARVTGTIVQLTPVLAGLGIGFAVRSAGVIDRSASTILFKVVFYVCAPALIFTSISQVEISRHLMVFPFAALLAVSSGYAVARLVTPRLSLATTRTPVFFLACMIVNAGFMLPFAQALFGAEGVARIAAFDIINGLLTFTWVHTIAARGNPERRSDSMMINRVLKSPPLIGILLGLVVNFLNIRMPEVMSETAIAMGAPTGFLITLASGIAFRPTRHLSQPAAALGVRLFTSSLIAAVLIFLLGLHGVDRSVLILLCIAPIGFNCVTFASLENLDVEFATSALSASLVSGLTLALAASFVIT